MTNDSDRFTPGPWRIWANKENDDSDHMTDQLREAIERAVKETCWKHQTIDTALHRAIADAILPAVTALREKNAERIKIALNVLTSFGSHEWEEAVQSARWILEGDPRGDQPYIGTGATS